jgi:O-antigen/teichoic acid export membrane protein
MLGRSVTLNIIGGFGSLAIGFASNIVLARWLGPSDRGLLAVMLTMSTVGLGIVGLGLPMAVMYFASLRESRAGVILGDCLAFAVVITVVLLPLVWAFHHPIARVLSKGHGGLAWVLAGALVPITFLDWTTHNQLIGKLRFGLYNALVIVSKLVTLVLVAMLVAVLGLGVTGGLLATAGASAVMIFGSLPTLLREGRPSIDVSFFRRMVGYGSRVQLGTLFQMLNYRLDTVILQAFVSLRSVGYYAVAQILAELVTTIASAFQTSVLPLVARAEGLESQAETTAASIRHHGILAVFGTIANAAFGTIVILWFYGPAFHKAIVPMLILLPGMWFIGTGAVITGDLRGRGRPGLSSTLAGLTVVVTVALDLALIPPFGVNGAAIASDISYAVFGIISLVAMRRVTGLSIRSLVVPTRADLLVYPAYVRELVGRVRRSRPLPAE